MNIDERERLVRFLDQLVAARAVDKNGEADALIRAACARQADAAYLLAQRAMLLEQAVQNSQSEIDRLRDELAQTRAQAMNSRANSGFIDANSWGNSQASRPAAPQPPTPESVAQPTAGAWGTGLLGTIASTAAGVVAGNFLYQGIEHLLGDRRPLQVPSSTAAAAHDSAAATDQQDDSAAGVFDTSSVDDYIAGNDNA